MTPTASHESAAFDFAWTNVVSNCTTFTFNNYTICTIAGATPPTTPSGTGVRCTNVATRTATSATNHFIHRSDKQFSARIFACQNFPCTQYYGSGYGSTVTNDYDSESTDPERWVLEDVADFTDNSRLIIDPTASASGALMYPSGFNLVGRLGIWWSTVVGGVDVIRFKHSQDTGWQNWNTYSNWHAENEVARQPGGATPGGAFAECTHPWVTAVDDGVTQSIRLFVHCGVPPDLTVWSVDSVNEDGSNFGLICTVSPGGCIADTDTCPTNEPCDWEDDVADSAPAVEELCNDGSAGCFYLDVAGHGRMMWDYVANGPVDFGVDYPMMMFTGSADNTGCPGDVDPDNIYMADWDGAAWDIATTGTCPVDAAADVHDPGIMPLPTGEFKMYFLQDLTQFYVSYWDGSSWGDTVEIELAFDDSTPTGAIDADLQDCLRNVDVLVYPSGGSIYEGAFFKQLPYDSMSAPTCFTTGVPNAAGGAFGGVVYAEHRN